MVKLKETGLNATFAALSDPTRRAILARLVQGECTVMALAEPFAMSLPAISKHLRILENAGLLAREIEGRVHRCRLQASPMKNAAEWIARYRAFWEMKFDALDDYLKRTQTQETPWLSSKPSRKTHSALGAASTRRVRKSSARGPTRKH